tara:strand:- start:35501 stop:35908 length:408 start_codon:yes stop_codon:yes gene_type:complete
LKNKIKFSITNSNHLILSCKVNNIKGRFILDTGASNSCINSIKANKYKINFKFSKEIASTATNKIDNTFFSKDNTLEIGELKKNDFEVILFDMSHINKSFIENSTKSIDGIIGSDILNEFNAIIDFKEKILLLEH